MILLSKLEKIMEGHGTEGDLADLESWCAIVKSMSRCGLGQTSPNPIQSTLKNFREAYEERIKKGIDYQTGFDLSAAVQESCRVAGRIPNIHEDH